MLRQAATENPEVIKDVSTSFFKDVSTSFGKTRWSWQIIATCCGSAIATSVCTATTFSFFSTLGRNVADLKIDLADLNSDLKQRNAQYARLEPLDARLESLDARLDAFDVRFEKVYVGTVSLALGVQALLMIGLCVLKEIEK